VIFLPDGQYTVIPNTEVLTPQGNIRRSYDPTTARGPWNGRRIRQTDPANWHVAVEPEAWPVNRLDLVRFPDGREVVVQTAEYRGPTPGTSDADIVAFVQIEGRMRDAAQQPT
jgi:hypothetical protein